MAGERGLSEERYEALRAENGFDQPLWVQFRDYPTGILQGDLGAPFTNRPV